MKQNEEEIAKRRNIVLADHAPAEGTRIQREQMHQFPESTVRREE